MPSSSQLGHPPPPSEPILGGIPPVGGSSRVESAGRLEEQPTVISQHPPLSPAELEGRPERLAAGERLEHFEILELIGGGGMARVYRARDTRLERIVAVKVLTAEHAAEPETRQRFQNEAKSAAQLDHENIARVYYVGEDRGVPFIVYEYIHGINLRAMVEQRGPLPLVEAVHYTLQVAEALAHAASRKIVHRDIKPSNILITAEGRAKLIDLGLARIHKPLSPGHDLTATGVTLGTFDYIAPEQARDPRTADVRSDIYSLGCAFFFMLVGRPPFPEGTVLQKLLQHQTEEPPDPRIWRPELPESVLRILRKMLAKDPADRYQEAEDLVADLLALADLLGAPATGRSRTVWITPRHARLSYLERHLPWLVPLAALLAGVMVLDWLWSSGTQPEQWSPSGFSSGGSPSNPAPTSSPNSLKGQPSGGNNPPGSSSLEGGTETKSPLAPPANPFVPPNPTGSKPAEGDLPPQGVSPPEKLSAGAEVPQPTLSSEKSGMAPETFEGGMSAATPFEGEIRAEKSSP